MIISIIYWGLSSSQKMKSSFCQFLFLPFKALQNILPITHLFFLVFFNICEIRKYPTIDGNSSFNRPSCLVVYEIMMTHKNSGVLDLIKYCTPQSLALIFPDTLHYAVRSLLWQPCPAHPSLQNVTHIFLLIWNAWAFPSYTQI